MRLILIRHGQTSSNVLNLLDTSVPGPGLTDLGARQAQALLAALAGLTGTQPSALYASTQTRAQQTAAPLAAALGLTVQVRDGLREIAAGELEMKGDVPSIMAYLSTVRNWLLGDLEVRMPGGSTGTEVLQRFDAVVREAEKGSDGGTVAMVSHGAMIRTWAGYRASNIDAAHPENYDLSNTGIVILEGSFADDAAQSGWRVLSWTSQGAGAELADPDTDGPTAELADPASTGPGSHAGN
ncbi:histidine phosphatase family protein [Paenarthrobacter sp. Z7-10]|uniref:histidine phosphatase family protein n=1 Tax=Paenarthrobacter sp. Z7-10 TaxID=2787635 RepID=UPI0022A93561|nr:histidine phosphatase family protein [Paenarthrobacter sp. Z7-10]MCZ2402261.1 histidine phosphatase family protein [Paenarthrobacter sp. Z7-10]